MCLFLWQASLCPVLGNETKSITNVDMNSESETTTLVIQRGDTLWDLSRKYQTTVNELVRLNQFKSPHQIREGQLIQVPKQEPKEPIVKTQERYPMDDLIKTIDPYPRYSMTNPESVKEETTEQILTNKPWWEVVLQKISFFAGNKAEPVTLVSSDGHPSQSGSEIKVYEVFVNVNTDEKPAEKSVVKPAEKTTEKLSLNELAGINDQRSQLTATKSDRKSVV